MHINRIIILILAILLYSTSVWGAYVIDGDLSDWGVNPAIGDWIPDSPTADVHETDNFPEYSSVYYGYNRSAYDFEAIYFDDTPSHFYVALVTKYNPDTTATDRWIGDLWFDFTNDMIIGDSDGQHGIVTGLDYALFIGSSPRGTVVKIDDLATDSARTIYHDVGHDYYAQGSPWLCTIDPCDPANASKVMGVVDANDMAVQRDIVVTSSYMMEMKIPRSLFGADSDAEKVGLHITMWCGNDQSTMRATTSSITIIPSPSALILVGIGTCVAGLFRRRQVLR